MVPLLAVGVICYTTEVMETTNTPVMIYTTPVCHFCHAAKDFFNANKVSYEEVDVASNAEARQNMIEMTGQMGVPVIQIGDDVVVGFDEGKIKELLQL